MSHVLNYPICDPEHRKRCNRLTCLVVTLASKDVYGASLYKMFPYCAPAAGSHEIKAVQAEIPG